MFGPRPMAQLNTGVLQLNTDVLTPLFLADLMSLARRAVDCRNNMTETVPCSGVMVGKAIRAQLVAMYNNDQLAYYRNVFNGLADEMFAPHVTAPAPMSAVQVAPAEAPAVSNRSVSCCAPSSSSSTSSSPSSSPSTSSPPSPCSAVSNRSVSCCAPSSSSSRSSSPSSSLSPSSTPSPCFGVSPAAVAAFAPSSFSTGTCTTTASPSRPIASPPQQQQQQQQQRWTLFAARPEPVEALGSSSRCSASASASTTPASTAQAVNPSVEAIRRIWAEIESTEAHTKRMEEEMGLDEAPSVSHYFGARPQPSVAPYDSSASYDELLEALEARERSRRSRNSASTPTPNSELLDRVQRNAQIFNDIEATMERWERSGAWYDIYGVHLEGYGDRTTA